MLWIAPSAGKLFQKLLSTPLLACHPHKACHGRPSNPRERTADRRRQGQFPTGRSTTLMLRSGQAFCSTTLMASVAGGTCPAPARTDRARFSVLIPGGKVIPFSVCNPSFSFAVSCLSPAINDSKSGRGIAWYVLLSDCQKSLQAYRFPRFDPCRKSTCDRRRL